MQSSWFSRSRSVPDGPRMVAEPSGTASGVDGYDLELRRANSGSDDLIVTFSPGKRFALYRHDFGCDALFVADTDLRYYLRDIPGLAKTILRVIDRGRYDRVLFVGSSKGGFGALAVARQCARMRAERLFRVVAFSPQVRLFPENPGLYFKSYGTLMRRAAAQSGLKRALRRFGDVSKVGVARNLLIEIIYASAADVDRIEAHRISGPQVSHRVVAGETHGTAFHFMCHGFRRAEIKARIKRAYRRTGDKDLRQTRPKDLAALIDEVTASAQHQPTLNELFAQALDREPAPRIAERSGLRARALDYLVGSIEKTLRPALGKS